ncbi:hypothetical protein [Halovenus salina]|uniref:Uncharacterized protein n=1 Tax=Halovenus salina TaxID=1510225 RepID=A0ABD5W259_9EURY
MRRRRFLYTSLGTGLTLGLAGCSTGSTDESSPTERATSTSTEDGTSTRETATPNKDQPTETPSENEATEEDPDDTNTDEDDQQTEEDPETAVRYFFEDETGTLGHLADDDIPDDYDNVITNTTTEEEYQEKQRNDRQYPEGMEEGQLTKTVDEMIERAEEIYNNPEEHIEAEIYDDLDLAAEDDEITFTRALIKATQEAGVTSSGLANIVVANIAEDAIEQIQPGFTDYKLSTLPATEPANPGKEGHSGGVRENEFGHKYGNSGFRHMPGLLQYQKDGETKVKYAEQTDATNVNIFRRVIRNPDFSLYRSSLEQDTVNVSRDSKPGDSGHMFPEHYVTALDYTKARELEKKMKITSDLV